MSTPVLAWIGLVLAGLFEVAWAVGLKHTEGFTKLWPSLGTAAAMITSFALLSQALRTLPVGTAYAVWTGIGAVGAATAGILFLGESASPLRVAAILLIVLGIVGLKVAT